MIAAMARISPAKDCASGQRRFLASGVGGLVQKDQPLEVVDEVRHADFHFCSGDPDRADE